MTGYRPLTKRNLVPRKKEESTAIVGDELMTSAPALEAWKSTSRKKKKRVKAPPAVNELLKSSGEMRLPINSRNRLTVRSRMSLATFPICDLLLNPVAGGEDCLCF